MAHLIWSRGSIIYDIFAGNYGDNVDIFISNETSLLRVDPTVDPIITITHKEQNRK